MGESHQKPHPLSTSMPHPLEQLSLAEAQIQQGQCTVSLIRENISYPRLGMDCVIYQRLEDFLRVAITPNRALLGTKKSGE